MLEELQFAFGVTGPILILLILGYYLNAAKLIDQHFTKQATKLVFNIALPVLLFFALAKQDITQSFNMAFVASGLLGTLLLVVLLLVLSKRLPADQRGVFIQGAYRGNMGIVSVALAVASYGEAVLAIIGVYIAFATTLYNMVAVWVLGAKSALRRIFTNPIILGIALGSLASIARLPLPTVAIKTGEYISDLTLPIALICIGASLTLRNLKDNQSIVIMASFIKLFVSPAIIVGVGWLLGLRDDLLILLFLLSAVPTASASYFMAQQMTNSGELAAEIIAATTVFSVITLTIGMAVLRTY